MFASRLRKCSRAGSESVREQAPKAFASRPTTAISDVTLLELNILLYLPRKLTCANPKSNIVGAVASITGSHPGIENEKTPTMPLVNWDSATRWARRFSRTAVVFCYQITVLLFPGAPRARAVAGRGAAVRRMEKVSLSIARTRATDHRDD
ncbi:hypothetical protein SBV1_310028 [Verrucomicrobia bacterium]|nr:hypothetical protein SBV1_310028 [Verrucomicrobiota bacterium]